MNVIQMDKGGLHAIPSSDKNEKRLVQLIDRLPLKMQRAVRWLRRPSSRWARAPAGIFLMIGGVLGALPILGFWMLPLGLALLAEDAPPLRRVRDRMLNWIARRRPHWFAPPAAPLANSARGGD